MTWWFLALLFLVTPAVAAERLELHVPDRGSPPPPPMTTWWDVAEITTDAGEPSVVLVFTGDAALRRVCTFNGPEAVWLIDELKAPAPPSRHRRAFEAAQRKGCLGRGIISGTP